jgi:hypothetical protein
MLAGELLGLRPQLIHQQRAACRHRQWGIRRYKLASRYAVLCASNPALLVPRATSKPANPLSTVDRHRRKPWLSLCLVQTSTRPAAHHGTREMLRPAAGIWYRMELSASFGMHIAPTRQSARPPTSRPSQGYLSPREGGPSVEAHVRCNASPRHWRLHRGD